MKGSSPRKTISTAAAVEHLTHFQHRVVIEGLLDGWAVTWERAARRFEAARHRPGIDFAGNATIEELRARWLELTELANACRARAQVSPLDLATEFDDVLRETAA